MTMLTAMASSLPMNAARFALSSSSTSGTFAEMHRRHAWLNSRLQRPLRSFQTPVGARCLLPPNFSGSDPLHRRDECNFALVQKQKKLQSIASALPSLSVAYGRYPMIEAYNTWGVWAVLLLAAAGGLWSERTKWGRAMSGPLVSTLIGLIASNSGIIPWDAPAYAVVNSFLLPLAVPLLLFAADLRRVVRETGRLLGAFMIGAVGTTVGTWAAWVLMPLHSLGTDGWKVAAALMSRHIGGAVNYVAVTEALGASSSVVASGLAADNLICAIYFTSLFALAANIPPDPFTGAVLGDGEGLWMEDGTHGRGAIGVRDGATALAVAGIMCFAGTELAKRSSMRGGAIPCTTAVAVLAATFFPSIIGPLAGAGEGLSVLLLQVFFAVVGASGSVASVVRTAPSLFLFSFLQIAFHLAFTLLVGQAMGFERKELLLASNANVGGPTTGAGMAAAKGWRSLMMPTVLIGVFGYAIATFMSIAFGINSLRK